LKLRFSELAPTLGIALFIVIVQILSLLIITPLVQYGMQAFSDPQSVWNPLFYIVLIILFTAALLLIIKYKVMWLIQGFMALAVLSTLVYVLFGLIALIAPGISFLIGMSIAAVISIVMTVLLMVYPEWYVIDISGVLVATGATAIFGVSLGIIPTLLLLVLLAIYDYISVYKTKHMVRLAEGVMDLKLPIMFVVPRRWGYQYRQASGKIEPGQEREAYFMGLGDAVMPSMLAVSANRWILNAPGIWFINYPALGAMIGTLISYAALMYIVATTKKPQAGLPFLCTGAIVGFLIGCVAAGVNPF
jgi:presenilin-like A22 family membrane protease